MPAKLSSFDQAGKAWLTALGQKIRAQRKALRVNATAAAEAARMSRVTLHRIETGEGSVTMGAYLNALGALGLSLEIAEVGKKPVISIVPGREGGIPARISLEGYPQLRQLAWHVPGTDVLTPTEAFGIYERNERHLDWATLEPNERELIDALRTAFGGSNGNV